MWPQWSTGDDNDDDDYDDNDEHRDGSGCGTHYILREDGLSIACSVPHRPVPTDENEYQIRNQQLNQRTDEIRRVIDLLAKLNEGELVENIVDPKIDLTGIQGNLDMTHNLFLLGNNTISGYKDNTIILYPGVQDTPLVAPPSSSQPVRNRG